MKKRIVSFLLVIVIVFSFAPAAGAVTGRSLFCANSLYTLGLFKGVGQSYDGSPIFELDRAPTRAEAVVMLVRLLGKEKEALAGSGAQPFSDVESWAAPYIGYAYSAGLTQGIGSGQFGSNQAVTASQYITFVLRALGYSSEKDFKWDSAWTLSDSLGLTDGYYNTASDFLRGDVAILSYNALAQSVKGGTSLLSSLYSSGVVSSSAIANVGLSNMLGNSLSPSEVYEKCVSAVFNIIVYDSTGHALGQASGFFIDSNGTAVTNYHVIEDAYSAKIKTLDGKIYNVQGVYGSDATNDLALIKIEGTNFPYLELGDSDYVSVGSTVYTIGNPQGLEGTISQGIVSYYFREIDNTPYIQITAPISPGSSGGVLLDTAGKVIGITTGGITSGQSLNLAVPINYIKGVQRTSYISLDKNIPTAGKEIGYSFASTVPDYGAYFGKNMYSSRSRTNMFTLWYKKSANAKDPVADYGALLEKWGFAYKKDYTTENVNGKYFEKGNVKVLNAVVKEPNTGVEYIIVEIELMTSSYYSKVERGSDGYPSVPSFEVYFGLQDGYVRTVTTNGFVQKFAVSEVNAIDTQAVSVYCALLEKWGFVFKYGSSVNGATTFAYAKNNITVLIEKKDGFIIQTVIVSQ